MEKKTKIVATISDMNCGVPFLTELYENGMNVVRLNTAHQTEADSLKVVESTRKVADDIALLIDTKGPEIRTRLEDKIVLAEGEVVYIVKEGDKVEGAQYFATSYDKFVTDVPVGSSVLIDDGETEISIEAVEGDKLKGIVGNAGTIKNKKSINVPGISFDLPSLTEKDKMFVDFAIKQDLDFIAHSFVRNREDVLEIQEMLDAAGSKVKIIAKIENHEGVENIDEILDVVYGVMVARGDLAIELPYEKIPGIQKMLLNKCIERRKPVIVATQMLHTMIENPRPTRAEVSDIANAIFHKADAIMLSGETAYGKYPVEAVKTMNKVAVEAEKSRTDYHNAPTAILANETSSFLAKTAVKTSIKLDVEAIVADTRSGRTIRNLSGYRGKKVVYAQCYDKRVARELALSFGVCPIYVEKVKGVSFVKGSLEKLVNNGDLKVEHNVVVLGGNYGAKLGASYIEIGAVSNLIDEFKHRSKA
ncbi:pyruvate kinase [Bacteroidales bacterium]|nr:pyruvate kinase [Bacteroidales bacterium]